jgi:hypothetical protein
MITSFEDNFIKLQADFWNKVNAQQPTLIDYKFVLKSIQDSAKYLETKIGILKRSGNNIK